MKKILLPTDFSEIADNATEYALQMLGNTMYKGEATFILLHVANFINPPKDIYGGSATFKEPEFHEKAQEVLQASCTAWKAKYPELTITDVSTTGKVVSTILEYIKEENIDLVVMGSFGLTGVSRLLLGSTTSELCKLASCPVLVIPEAMRFQKPERVVFATDFKNPETLEMLGLLKEISDQFKPELSMLHIYPEKKSVSEAMEKNSRMLKDYFGNEKYKRYFLEDNDPTVGIEDFVSGYNADMLVLTGSERSFFENLFHRSIMKKMIAYSKIPLLILNQETAEHPVEEKEPFREKVQSQVEKWKGELESLNVQMNLGKAELSEKLGERRKVVDKKISEVKAKINHAGTVREGHWKNFKAEMSEAIGHLKKTISGKA